jgi:hypothetical protein
VKSGRRTAIFNVIFFRCFDLHLMSTTPIQPLPERPVIIVQHVVVVVVQFSTFKVGL